MRQHLSFREHFRRGNAHYKLFVSGSLLRGSLLWRDAARLEQVVPGRPAIPNLIAVPTTFATSTEIESQRRAARAIFMLVRSFSPPTRA